MREILPAIFFLLNICMENTQQITVADLDLIRRILELAFTRGAFQAGEAKEVGEVYNKVTAFLKDVITKSQELQSTNEEQKPYEGEM